MAKPYEDNDQVFLLKLSDTLRAEVGVEAVGNRATQLIAQQLEADRVYLVTLNPEDDTVLITHETRRQDLPPLRGSYRSSNFPTAIKELFERTIVYSDVSTDARLTDLDRMSFAGLGAVGFIATSLRRGSQTMIWAAGALSSGPRSWTAAEVTLFEDAVERTWAAVERARAEEALTKSEERLQLATHAAQIGTFIYYPKEDRGEPDAQMLRLYGLPPDDTLNLAKALAELLYPDDRERYANQVAQALNPAGSGKLDSDIRIVHADGSVHWMNVRGQVVFENGQAVRMPGVSTDITERKRQEANLAFLAEVSQSLVKMTKPEEILDVLGSKIGAHFNTIRCSFVEIFADQDKAIVHDWHGPEMSSVAGQYPLSQLLGERYRQKSRAGESIVIPDAYQSDLVNGQQLEAVFGAVSLINIPLVRNEQWIFTLGIHDTVPRHWRADEIEVLQELTDRIWTQLERTRAEEVVRRSEGRLQRMINVPHMGVLTFDYTGRLLHANDAFVNMVGYTRQEFEARSFSWLDFTPPEYTQVSEQVMQRLLETMVGGPYEKEYFRQDGSRVWLMFVGANLGDGTIVEYAVDISDRKQAEHALREANQRKDEFLAMLAHELRNPMSTIRSGLQILTITDGKDQTSSDTIVMMNRQTDHLVRMVDDLLDVGRISQGKIELKRQRVDLVKTVAQAAESAQVFYQEQGRRLQVDLPIASIEVEGDGVRLSQVVTNLLTNGARYTGESGQVWLRLMHRSQEAIIEVSDNGIGLAADQLEAIFELFVQVDNSLARSKGGLGLGLTLVKRLVELHGGWVEVQSEGVGKGSTFRVHLPTINTTSDPIPMPAEDPSTKITTQRILVIDDNADAAFTLSMLLKLNGYEVHSRHSGAQGVQVAQELHPGVILCDIGMPGMDGYETARAIRQQPWGRDVLLIALTGYGQEEDRQRTREAGFDGHLVKPVDLTRLTEMVAERLGK